MKKIIQQISTIVFLLYFIGVTTGVNLSLHFCEGKVADVSILENSGSCNISSTGSCHDDACHVQFTEQRQSCHTDNTDNCCTDEYIYITLEASSLFSLYSFSFDISSLSLLNNVEENIETQSNSNNSFSEFDDLRISYPPPYLAFQQLIFYS